MATTSYLTDVAGGPVAAAAFEDDDAAVTAVTMLRDSGVREQDISVVAADPLPESAPNEPANNSRTSPQPTSC